MRLLGIVKRAILEGKLDAELGIADGDVVKRYNAVQHLFSMLNVSKDKIVPDVDKLLDRIKGQQSNPYWKNQVYSSSEGVENEKSNI